MRCLPDGQVFLSSVSPAFMCHRVLNLGARVAQDHVRCCLALSQMSSNMCCSSGGLIQPRIVHRTSCKLGEIRPSSRLPTAQWQSLSHTFEDALGSCRRLGLAIFHMLFLQPQVDLNIREALQDVTSIPRLGQSLWYRPHKVQSQRHHMMSDLALKQLMLQAGPT